MSISASTKATTITAPPGGPGQQSLRVSGSNFSPNAPITLSFRQYPALKSGEDQFQRSTMANASGGFYWVVDLFTLPALNYSDDPNTDVWITAKETSGGCFAMTNIKAQQFFHPPL